MDNKDMEYAKRYVPSPEEDPLPDIQLTDDASLRRKLNDDFVNSASEKMKVFLRIRSFQPTEMNQNCIEMVDSSTVTMHPLKDSLYNINDTSKYQKFIFSHVCGPEVGQEEFYNICMKETVTEFIEGQNWLVFAYGITNSGKSYTVQGTPLEQGIIPRTLNVLFNNIQKNQAQGPLFKPHYFSDVISLSEKQQQQEIAIKELLIGSGNTEEVDNESEIFTSLSKFPSQSSVCSEDTFNNTLFSKCQDNETFLENKLQDPSCSTIQQPVMYSVWISFFEIYNEHILDLLEPINLLKNRTKLYLSEDKNGNPFVKGLCEVCVSSAKEAYQILKFGQKNLHKAATKLNHVSSRSHCIFTIKVIRVIDAENPCQARINRLSFCDLAGSERYSKTQNIGERLKEAGNINSSLMVLGRCIETLRYNQNHREKKVIPFRDSKLTRIFQSFFTGKGQVSMIVNVSQDFRMFDETLNVMKFSAIAKQVMTSDIAMTGSIANRIVNRLTAMWARSSQRWLSFAKQRPVPKYSNASSTVDETSSVVEETIEEEKEVKTDDDDYECYQELVDLVKYLEKELIDAKKENALMETKIRTEVSEEFKEHITEMEKVHSESVKNAIENTEVYMQKRIDLLQKVIDRQNNECQSGEESETDDENNNATAISSELLQNNEDKLQQQHDQSSIINQLEERIKDLETKVLEMNKIIDEKEDTIQKAGAIFVDKEYELEKYKNEVNNSKLKIESQKEEIIKLTTAVQQVQSNLDSAINRLNEAKKENLTLQEKVKCLTELKDEQIKSKSEDFKVPTSELDNKLKELEKENYSLQITVDNLQKELAETRLQTVNELSQVKLENNKNSNLCSELKQKLSLKCVEADELRNKCEEYEEIIKNMENKLDEYRVMYSGEKNKDSEINELQEKLNSFVMYVTELTEAISNDTTTLVEEPVSNGRESLKENCEVCDSLAECTESETGEEMAEAELSSDLFRHQNETLELCEITQQENFFNNSGVTDKVENTRKMLKTIKEKIDMLTNQVQTLEMEKSKFVLILSKAEQQLKQMLYTNDSNVIHLMKEMCTKWNDVNHLTTFLEEKLIYLLNKHEDKMSESDVKIKNLIKELCNKTGETENLKSKLEMNNNKVEELSNTIIELQSRLQSDTLKTKQSYEADDIEEKRMLFAELELVKSKLEASNTEIEKLKNVEKDYLRKTEEMRIGLEDSYEEKNRTEVSLQELKFNFKQKEEIYNNSKDELTKKNIQLQSKFEQQLLEVDEMERKNSYMENEMKRMQNLIDELELTKSKLDASYVEINNLKEITKDYQKRIDEITITLENSYKENEQLKSQAKISVEELKNDTAQENEKYNNAMNELQTLKGKLQDNQHVIAEYLKERDSLNKSIDEIRHKLDQSEKAKSQIECQMEMSLSELRNNIQRKEEEYNDIANELKVTTEKLQESYREKDQLENQLASYLSEKNEVAKELNKLRSMSDEKDDTEKQLKEMHQKYNLLENTLAQKAMEISKLKLKADEKDDAEMKLQEMHQKYNLLENTLEQKAMEISKLKLKADEKDDAEMKLQEMHQKYNLLENTLEQKAMEISKLKLKADEKDDAEMKLQEMHQKYNVLENTLEQKAMEISKLKLKADEKDDAEMKLQEMHQKYNVLENTLEQKAMEISKLKVKADKKDDTEMKLQKIQQKCNILENILEQKAMEISELKVNILQLDKECKKYKEEKSVLTEKLENVQRTTTKEDISNNTELQESLNTDKETLKLSGKKVASVEKQDKVTRRPTLRQKRTRRKRFSDEGADNELTCDDENDDKEGTTKSTSNLQRPQRTRRQTRRNILSDEDEEFLLPPRRTVRRQVKTNPKQQDENIPEDEVLKSPLKRIGNYIRGKTPTLGAMTESILNMFAVTGDESKTSLQEPKRKRRQLFNVDGTDKFAQSPSAQEEKAISPHTTVRRQLRTRNQKKNYNY